MRFHALPFILLFLASQPKCLGSEELAEWIIKQSSPIYGEHSIYIAPNAVRIVNKEMRYELLSTAPEWKVKLFQRDSGKLFIEDRFDANQLSFWKPVDKQNNSEKRSLLNAGQLQCFGFNCTRYLEPGSSYIVCADDIKVAPQVARLICDYYKITEFKQVPLNHFYTHDKTPSPLTSSQKQTAKNSREKSKPSNGSKTSGYPSDDWLHTGSYGEKADFRFRTNSCEKSVLKASDFSLPAGLHHVQSTTEILIGAKKNEINSMLDSIGFTADDLTAGTQPKRSGKAIQKP